MLERGVRRHAGHAGAGRAAGRHRRRVLRGDHAGPERSQRYLAMVSSEGGMDIEEVARTKPDAIRRVRDRPAPRPEGLPGPRTWPGTCRRGGASGRRGRAAEAVRGRSTRRDATLVEVNPLVLLTDGRGDARSTRRSRSTTTRCSASPTGRAARRFPVDPTQARANEKGLQYVKLDGEVGIIGNGAGLVMSTLDVVTQAGGEPANFLDVGGGASADVMATSLEVVLSDPRVRIGAGQHLRRDHPGRPGRAGHPGGARAGRGRGSRSSSGWTAPTPRRAGGSWPRRTIRRIVPAATMLEAAERAADARARGGLSRWPSSIDAGRPGSWSRGSPGKEGTFHALRNRAYGTQVVAGVTPGKGGQDVEGIPVFDTVARGGRGDRGRTRR